MAFTQFAENQSVHVADTGERLDLGTILPSQNGELQYIRQVIYINGTPAASDEVFLGLHLSTDFTAAYATSNSIFLLNIIDEVTDTPTGGLLADVRFTFDRVNINKNQTYYVSLQTNNYTRNANTYYIGAVRDYPFPITEVAVPRSIGWMYPAKKAFFMFVEPS